MERDNKVNIVIDKEFFDKCDEKNIYVDYPNIIKIVHPGSRIYIDDGLISLIVLKVGKSDRERERSPFTFTFFS